MYNMVGEQTIRFPDGEWWAERSARHPIPDYCVDLRPDDVREYGTDVESIVRRIVERVVKKFDPIAVWLFGSMARGDCDKHSDVDLMVIIPDGTDCWATTVNILVELASSMLPKDVLVNTQSLFAGAEDMVGSIQHSVRRHGVMLYG